jgi:hypothetical protein
MAAAILRADRRAILFGCHAKLSVVTASIICSIFPAENCPLPAHDPAFPRIISKASHDDRDFSDQRNQVASNRGQQKHTRSFYENKCIKP